MGVDSYTKTAVLTGHTSGLGLEILRSMMRGKQYKRIYGIAMESLPVDAIKALEDETASRTNLAQATLDLADLPGLGDFCSTLIETQLAGSKVHTLINCAGVNEISMLKDLSLRVLDRLMTINAFAPVWLVKNLLPTFTSQSVVCNIISNASHMPMTSSCAYNMSKAALHIATKQMARELGKSPTGLTVFGVSPNKLAGTGMSSYIDKRVCETRGWTMDEARKYQLAALPAGEETDPKVLGEFVAFLTDDIRRCKYLQGCVLPYGGPVQ